MIAEECVNVCKEGVDSKHLSVSTVMENIGG